MVETTDISLSNDLGQVLPQLQPVKQLIRETFPEEPEIMLAIAECESNTLQTVNGKVVNSPTNDWGVMQIHRPIWEKKSKELGLDIMTLKGNIQMARHIYEVQGKTAWATYNNGCYKQFIAGH